MQTWRLMSSSCQCQGGQQRPQQGPAAALTHQSHLPTHRRLQHRVVIMRPHLGPLAQQGRGREQLLQGVQGQQPLVLLLCCGSMQSGPGSRRPTGSPSCTPHQSAAVMGRAWSQCASRQGYQAAQGPPLLLLWLGHQLGLPVQLQGHCREAAGWALAAAQGVRIRLRVHTCQAPSQHLMQQLPRGLGCPCSQSCSQHSRSRCSSPAVVQQREGLWAHPSLRSSQHRGGR